MGLMEGWKIINFWRIQLEEAGRNHPLQQFSAMHEDMIAVNDAAKRRELRYQRGTVSSDRMAESRAVLLYKQNW